MLYYWMFDDGNISTVPNPEHTYSKDGLYRVSLSIVNSNGLCYDNITKEVQIGQVSCKSEFSYYVSNNTAYFYSNNNYGGTSSYWLFGDGAVSTDNNPVHTYKKNGYYKVSLTNYNPDTKCMDYSEKNILITSAGNDCYADFIYYVDTNTGTVKFYDHSTGGAQKWIWNFGDYSIDTVQNPVHQYLTNKKYNVCLMIVNNAGNADISCKEVIIDNNPENVCKADFIYHIDNEAKKVYFVNKSTGNYNDIYWKFDDGNTSNEANPTHTYADAGYYLVSLRILDNVNKKYDYAYKLLNVGSPDSFLIRFSYVPHPYNKKAGGYPVDFIGAGLGDEARLKWNFGDGYTDSTTNSPTHVYSTTGDYEVCISNVDPITGDASTYCEVVNTTQLCQNDLEPPVARCKPITLYLQEGQSVTLNPSQINNESYDDCSISKLEIDKSVFDKTGSYDVTLKVYDSNNNSNSCTATVQVLPEVAVNNVSIFNNISVYPNPFNNRFTLNYELKKDGMVEIQINDVSGRIIKRLKQGYLEKDNYTDIVDTQDFDKGVYLLQIFVNGTLNGQKIIIKQ